MAYRSIGGIDDIIGNLDYYREKIRQRRKEREDKLMPGFIAEETEEEKTLARLEEEFCLEEATEPKEISSHSGMLSSSFDLTSDWRLCLSEILFCYRLYAMVAFYTVIFFIGFGGLINNYLQIINNKQTLIAVLIWIVSFWLACLCCNFINFARRHRWYKKQESESSDMLDVSSLSDSMAPAPYTDGHGRKRFWYYKEQLSDSEIFLPKRISVTTTLFVALCTAVLAVTSYQICMFLG